MLVNKSSVSLTLLGIPTCHLNSKNAMNTLLLTVIPIISISDLHIHMTTNNQHDNSPAITHYIYYTNMTLETQRRCFLFIFLFFDTRIICIMHA